MAQRKRIEDLGIISEKLRRLLNSTLLVETETTMIQFMEKMKCADEIEGLLWELVDLKNEILHIYEIARYGDRKNG